MPASNQTTLVAWMTPGFAWWIPSREGAGTLPGVPHLVALLDSWRSAHAVGWDCLETMWGLRPPQRLRDRLLTEVRQAVAIQLRSPAFLELMRWNLGAMTVSNRLTTPFRIH
ncbi:MAG TPA: hypothetical protein VGP64_02280 [Polyangia bacterium]|jgi:hypothetical protein